MKSSVMRSPKSAFVMSVLALVLTVSMLVGTTFAWFTDGINNKANKIIAGNLDIVLQYWDGSDWANVTDTTVLFDNDALWEPGYTHQVALRVKNAGTLALKYQLSTFVLAEKEGVNAAGETFKLSDYIQFGVVEHEGVYATREEAVAAVAGASSALANGFFSAAKVLDTETDVEDYVTLVVYMPTSVGNEVNSKDALNLPEITLGLSLVATQTANEGDDFGNDYDDGVDFPAIEAGVLVTNVADMKAAIAEGKNVIIAADMAIDEVITVPAGKSVTINVGNANLSIDPSVTIGRPFELADGASLTINNSQSGVVAVGEYGLVNIPANAAADVTVNGGVYTANTDSGAFIKVRDGVANVNVTLNNVTYTDSYVGNFGGMVFNAEDISGVANVTVNGGSYSANAGFAGATALTVKNATITTQGIAVEASGVASIENCTITAGNQTVGSAPAVAVAASNNGVAVVKNSTITATTTALGVFPTGGTVSATGCEINGATKVWDMYAGKTGVITVDGAIVGQAGAVATANDAAALGTALAAGGTVVLTDDVVLDDAPITVADDAIIVLNGNTLSGKSTSSTTSNLIKVNQGATLTIADGTVSFYASKPDTEWGGVGQPAFPGYANNTINCQGKLVINGGVVENLTAAGGASYAIDCYPGADLVINDGEINGHGKCAIRMFANSNTEETKVTINGGNIIGSRGIWIQLPSSNIANVRKATLTINGGTITATKEGELAIYSYSYGDSFAGTNVTITGGTFNGPIGFGGGYAKTTEENVVITGGTFNGGVWRYLAGDTSVEITVPTT